MRGIRLEKVINPQVCIKFRKYMTKRITIMIDDDLDKKIRADQAKMIQNDGIS